MARSVRLGLAKAGAHVTWPRTLHVSGISAGACINPHTSEERVRAFIRQPRPTGGVLSVAPASCAWALASKEPHLDRQSRGLRFAEQTTFLDKSEIQNSYDNTMNE